MNLGFFKAQILYILVSCIYKTNLLKGISAWLPENFWQNLPCQFVWQFLILSIARRACDIVVRR